MGDEVPSSDGRFLVVVGLTWTDRIETVYNFGVEGFHTYFVGESGAWVHNCIKFRGLIRNRDLPDLTHNEIHNAFSEAMNVDASGHFIKRLRSERTEAMGIKSLRNVEKTFNKGEVMPGNRDGTIVTSFKDVKIVQDADSGRLVTITPGK